MRREKARSPVSFRVHVGRLPQNGMPVTAEADDAQRESLAAWHGLVSVERYRADLMVTPWKRRGVKVDGTVEADITQECVVTLEPVHDRIMEKVEGLFLPEDSKLGRLGFEGGGEILLDADGPDRPDTFAGDSIDVGALAEEFFALAIDPYPRKPDAVLPPAGEEEEGQTPRGALQEKLGALTRKS
jgi:hypothetical protein